jgi:hypothetical protein
MAAAPRNAKSLRRRMITLRRTPAGRWRRHASVQSPKRGDSRRTSHRFGHRSRYVDGFGVQPEREIPDRDRCVEHREVRVAGDYRLREHRQPNPLQPAALDRLDDLLQRCVRSRSTGDSCAAPTRNISPNSLIASPPSLHAALPSQSTTASTSATFTTRVGKDGSSGSSARDNLNCIVPTRCPNQMRRGASSRQAASNAGTS